ncbi:RNA polymerase sigma factor [Falsibacillus pallidus]|uniref:RNA polymerase sigma-70 factor (ECF subfamily) n=1 Tax=Falsibacillus pallidus TaxID=493781 RepID=A0A370GR65_9BACI|nr:sigma-70 family RNA polymerase sigma factor [Falsibacillus pallidus]RDI45736.1 RNA polymerase sigma-70 factor (ECF subfamily) [Falsibacillus pallidus]
MKLTALLNTNIHKKKGLVALAKIGDNEAFSTLIHENKRNLYRIAKAMLYQELDIEDAIQYTILSAYQNIKKLKKDEYFRTWLIRILINHCNNILRLRKRTISLEELSFPSASYEDTYKDMDLQEAIFSLKEDLRIVIILFYYEDLPSKDIAKLLKVPEGTVRSRLSIARKFLQKQLNLENENMDTEDI